MNESIYKKLFQSACLRLCKGYETTDQNFMSINTIDQ